MELPPRVSLTNYLQILAAIEYRLHVRVAKGLACFCFVFLGI